MKRYLLFYGDSYYPSGGWTDLKGSFDDEKEALIHLCNKYYDWWHIVDTLTMKITMCN